MSESHADLSERVVRLEAERDIVQRLHSYCHAIDHGTDDEFLDCFTDDAVWTMRFRGSVGEQQFSGRRAFREFIEKMPRPPQAVRKHLLLEPVVSLQGETAQALSYWLMIDADDAGAPQVNSFGRYRDQLRRESDGAWRLHDRLVDVEHWRPV